VGPLGAAVPIVGLALRGLANGTVLNSFDHYSAAPRYAPRSGDRFSQPCRPHTCRRTLRPRNVLLSQSPSAEIVTTLAAVVGIWSHIL